MSQDPRTPESQKTYTVEVRIDVMADSPEDAEAQVAFAIDESLQWRLTAIFDEEWEEVS